MDASFLTAALKQKAFCLGFDLAEATSLPQRGGDISHLEQWLAQGHAGGMRYFADRLEAYRDPNRVLEGAKSVLMLGMNYRTVDPALVLQAGQGRVSRYAWGEDYHDVIHERLRQLTQYFEQLVPGGKARGVVDTAPFLERRFAARAGLGWIGKNTALINPKLGSWLFLAALLTTEELQAEKPTGFSLPLADSGFRGGGIQGESENKPPKGGTTNELPEGGTTNELPDGKIMSQSPEDETTSAVSLIDDVVEPDNPCKNCHACLDACPTGALIAPYQLDARKCISYLTIEHRGEVPEEFKRIIGSQLFGCDACQEACPWNRCTPATTEKAFYPKEGMNPVELADLQNLDEESFRRRFRGTPLRRAKLEGLLRNAAIVQENTRGR